VTERNPHKFQLYSLEHGHKTSVPHHEVHLTKNGGHPNPVASIVHLNQVIALVDLGQMQGVVRMIDSLAHAKTTYRNALHSDPWRLLYNVRERNVSYIENETPVTKHELTLPCMNCGIVLPIGHISIDHQRPQSGGELEAVLKTLRVCGLTNEGPKGTKGLMLMRHLTQGLSLAPLPTRPNRPRAAGTSLPARYTLNILGSVLYSLLIAAQAEDELKARCMHGLMNLAPLCQPCNSSRGNPLKLASLEH
jgi:hypothetical protein